MNMTEFMEARTAKCPLTGCWFWLGTISNGYGRLSLGRRKEGTRRSALAHRIAYEMARGPIPDGLVIDHLCRQRSCVNPDHMELVSSVENVMRGESGPATNARKPCCPNGHPYESRDSRGWRICRICTKETDRRRWHERGKFRRHNAKRRELYAHKKKERSV